MSPSANVRGGDPVTPGMVFLGLPRVHVAEGSHIAHFFRGEQERLTVLAPFIKAGLEAGDQCVMIAETPALSTIKNRLRELGVDVESALASGQLMASDGFSEVEEIASVFKAVIPRARDAGRGVIRIGGDMTWTDRDLIRVAPQIADLHARGSQTLINFLGELIAGDPVLRIDAEEMLAQYRRDCRHPESTDGNA